MGKKLDFDNPLFKIPAKGPGAPKKNLVRHGAQKGLPKEYTRYTVILSKNTLCELKDFAYTERISIKDALEQMITTYISDYKKTHDTNLLSHNQKEG